MTRRMSEVLTAIGKAWINGADQFFSKLDPDPWEVAQSELEKTSSDTFDMAIEIYEARCLELLSLYRRMLELQSIKPPARAGIKDAFMKGFYRVPPEDMSVAVENSAGNFFK